MFDKIMNLVKGQVSETIASDSQIPADKREAAVETTATSIVDTMKQYLTPDNISSVTSMLGIAGDKHDGAGAEKISNGLQSSVVSNLTSKVGLDNGTAQKIAIAVIPAVIGLFSKKVKDNKEPGFNVGFLISTFTGGGKSSGRGIMDMVGSFLGKK